MEVLLLHVYVLKNVDLFKNNLGQPAEVFGGRGGN
jgi:hypothetical protein